MKKNDQGSFVNWLNTLETKYLIIAFVIWTVIYRLIDSQTLDWFGKDNKSSTIEYFLGLFIASAFFGSCIILILFPILKFLGLIKYDK
jgi:uncharacterized membrane protein